MQYYTIPYKAMFMEHTYVCQTPFQKLRIFKQNCGGSLGAVECAYWQYRFHKDLRDLLNHCASENVFPLTDQYDLDLDLKYDLKKTISLLWTMVPSHFWIFFHCPRLTLWQDSIYTSTAGY